MIRAEGLTSQQAIAEIIKSCIKNHWHGVFERSLKGIGSLEWDCLIWEPTEGITKFENSTKILEEAIERQKKRIQDLEGREAEVDEPAITNTIECTCADCKAMKSSRE